MVRGVDPSRITTEGYGKAYPVASNNDSGGRQLNRRVEVVIGTTTTRRSRPAVKTASRRASIAG